MSGPRDRYDVAGLEEAQREPGSRGRVLKNRLGIRLKREMDRAEGREQVRALEELATIYDKDHRFSAVDVRRMHQIWLGPIYPWAGQYRQVNVQKGDFPFAAAGQIPNLMADFERGPLRTYTPCRPVPIEKLPMAFAVVHLELVLIHPCPGGQWASCTTPGGSHGATGRPATAILRQAVGAETTAVLRCRAGGDGSKLRADGGDVQRRGPQDVTDSRTAVNRGEFERPFSSSVWGRRTPSMPIDVHTVMQNISYRLAGSRR